MKSARTVQNAEISGIDIKIERGIFYLDMRVNYDDSTQLIPAFQLYLPKSHTANADIMAFLFNLMQALNVKAMKNLKGKIVRVDSDWQQIYQIGHPFKDKWAKLPGGDK